MSNLKVTLRTREYESSADKCHRNGWVAGTRLVGDEGYGPTVIEITAVGRDGVLAVEISHNGKLTDRKSVV